MDHKQFTGPSDAGLAAGRADSANGRPAAGLPHQLEDDGWQRFDARLAAAMHEVPLPSGLADRLLARLQSADSISPADSVSSADSVSPADSVRPAEKAAPADVPAHAGRILLHRPATIGFAVAASLLIAVAAVWVLRSRDIEPLDAPHLAETWYTTLMEQTPHWQGLDLAPKELQIPDAIVARPKGCKTVTKIVGYKGVAYDLSGAQDTATLFVVRMPPVANLPSSPPFDPQWTSGGLAIGVWQSGGLRYALVVVGNEQAYRRLITTASPLAWLPFSKPRGFADRETALWQLISADTI